VRTVSVFPLVMAKDSALLAVAAQRRSGALTFSLLFALESMVRSLNASVLSIQAYDLLGSAQKVSLLAVAVSLGVLATTLAMPKLLGHVRRRYAYSFGILLMIAAGFCLATYSVPGQVAGTYLRNAGTAIANVTLQLYILDHIKRSELAHSEPLRLALSTVSWVAGPATGVWLYSHHGPLAAQLVSIGFGALLLAVFWILRLSETNLLPSGNLQGFRPLKNVRRFMAQPRLRLAWAIAFGRSCFWAIFFTYGPLLLIEGGLSKQFGGLLLSASQVLLLFTLLYGRLAKWKGVRLVIVWCFVGMAVTITLAGLSGTAHPYVTSALLLAASFFASGLDGVGAIPFLRAVKPHERPRMTPVYRSFIELSDLVPGIMFAAVLSVFTIGTAFVVLGLSMTILVWISWRYLPKSL
jgi:MFS family permease